MSLEQKSQTEFSADEFEKLVEERAARRLEKLLNQRQPQIPEEARLWMALAPGWTPELAKACKYPGNKDGDARSLFEQMRSAGLVEAYYTRPQIDEAEGLPDYYVMTPAARAETLQEYLSAGDPRRAPSKAAGFRKSPQTGVVDGARQLLEEAAKIGRRLQRVDLASAGAPPDMLRWAQLAGVIDTNDISVAGFFLQRVKDSFDDRNATEIRSWIEAARSLAALFEYATDLSLSLAIGQAGRQIELLERRRYDEAHLANFFERPEQVAAVRRLLESSDDPAAPWMLHFIGSGGVGKTMIIRFITCLLNSKPGEICYKEDPVFNQPTAVARLDFDFLNPDYPRLNPGLLLWSLSQELRAYGTGESDRLFNNAEQAFEQLRQELRAGTGRAGERPTKHPLFRRALISFIDALRSLQMRVVLILDTCEELAKASPDDAPNLNVEETFRILRALHNGIQALDNENASPGRGVASLRVILSGRHLLASGGEGWTSPDSSLPFRPFLRLHQIRGFSFDEATAFMHSKATPEHLIPVVIECSSPEAGSQIQVEWNNTADKPADIPRCNPYELRRFMDWAGEKPPPEAEKLLQAASGSYVEIRILQRLGDDPVKDVLPAAAWLGRFDAKLFKAATNLPDAAFQQILPTLEQQEWVGRRRVDFGGSGRIILDLQPGLRDGLQEHYLQNKQVPLSACRRAADYLVEFTLQNDLESLDHADFDTALRVLALEPERAAQWWRRIEGRLLNERGLPWAIDLLRFLVERDGACRKVEAEASAVRPTLPENPLRPLVLATLAAAYLHDGQPGKAMEAWQEVAEKCTGRVGGYYYRSVSVDQATSQPAGLSPDEAEPYDLPPERRSNLPQPVKARLARRALAGLLTSLYHPRYSGESMPTLELQERFWQAWLASGVAVLYDSQEASFAVAACEAMLETTENSDAAALFSVSARPEIKSARSDVVFPQALAKLFEERAVDKTGQETEEGFDYLHVFAVSLAGRALLLFGEPGPEGNALQILQSSIRSVDKFRNRSMRWLGWADPPIDLPVRLRLEFIRAVYPALLSPEETLSALGEIPSEVSTADNERLQSSLLGLHLAITPDAFGQMPWLAEKAQELAGQYFPAQCNAHRQTPPLFVNLARAAFAQGQVDTALGWLRQVAGQPQRYDLEAVRQAERALAGLLFKMRLNDERQTAGATLATSPELEDTAALLNLRALDGPRDQTPIDDYFNLGYFASLRRSYSPDVPESIKERLFAYLHLLWRSRYGVTKTYAERAVNLARQELLPRVEDLERLAEPENAGYFGLCLVMDVYEADLLNQVPNRDAPHLSSPSYPPADALTWVEKHPDRPEQALRLWARAFLLDASARWRDVQRQALVVRLGGRRAAEIVWEEAALLGLRLPDQAIVLLDEARALFHACGDEAGIFFCTLQSSMYLGVQEYQTTGKTLKDNPRLRNQFDKQMAEVENQYRRLQGQEHSVLLPPRPDFPAASDLPAWETLAQIAADPQSSALDALSPPTWRPWLLRLLFLKAGLLEADASSGPDAPRPTYAIWRWLTANYALSTKDPNDANLLPAEWYSWFRVEEKSAAPPVTTDQISTRTILIYFSIGCVLILLVAAGAFFLFRWLAGLGTAIEQWPYLYQIGAFILFVLGAWGIISLARWGIRGLGHSWVALGRVDADVSSQPIDAAQLTTGIASGSDQATFGMPLPSAEFWLKLSHWRPRLRLNAWPLYQLVEQELPTFHGQVENSSPYSVLVSLFTEEAHSLLATTANKLSQRKPIVTNLSIDPRLQTFNWEALFVLSLRRSEDASPADLPLRFLRNLPGAQSGMAAPGGSLRMVSLAGSQNAAGLASQVQGQVGARLQWEVVRSAQLQPEANVLHAVGSVEETSTGLALRLLAQDFYGSQVEMTEQAIHQKSASPFSEELRRWLTPADLRRLYPVAHLCILQGNPIEASTGRSDSDRLNASTTRHFASLLATQAMNVVVLPALPVDSAALALKRLVDCLPDFKHQGGAALLPGVAKAQADIVQGLVKQGMEQDAAWEVALDVSLFAYEG